MRRTILSLDEAARQIGRSVETMRYWRKRGEGPPTFRLGRRVVVDQAELDAWVDAQRAAEDPQGAA